MPPALRNLPMLARLWRAGCGVASVVLCLLVLAWAWRVLWVAQGQQFYEIFFRFDTRASGLFAGALLAASLQDFPRRLVEDYVLSRLHHDADLLYVRLFDAAAAAPGRDIDPAMLAGVGPFAIENGLVAASSPVTLLRIFNINTQKVVEALIQTPGGESAAARLCIISIVLALISLLISEWLARISRERTGR